MFRRSLLALLAVGLLAPAALASPDRLWLHVQVKDHEEDGDHVRINVPLSLAETVLPMIEGDDEHHPNFHFGHHNMDVDDLRDLWKEVKASGDNEFVTVESKDEKIRVTRQGKYIMVFADAADDEETVEIKMPLTVVDALLSGHDDELNFEAAIDALQKHGPSELVSVQGGDESVRIWVDGKSASE